MRYGIFGDIHGNLEALESVLADMEKQSVDQYICVGDVVGYGANPRECLRLVMEKKALIVAGNWEYAVSGKLNSDCFSSYARESALWTRNRLNREEKEFLASLDILQRVNDTLTFAHGTMVNPEIFEYIETSYDAWNSLALLITPVGFLGHSHVPVVFFQRETIGWSMDMEISIDKNSKTLVNVGSVGQPRDQDPRACYVVYDEDMGKVWYRRLDYDIQRAMDKIVHTGLPEVLGERLIYGR